MKKLLLLLVLAAFGFHIQAQNFTFGLKAGLSTGDVTPSKLGSIILKSQYDSLGLAVNNANYGFHFGIFARIQLSALFIQPEAVFNSSKVDFNVRNLTGGASIDSIRSESYQNLDVPVIVGAKYFGILRVGVGPVAHIHLTSSSDLLNYHGYGQMFMTATYGYQAGVGLDLGHVGVDLRYEGNFSNFGSQITFGGTPYQFSRTPERLIASLNIAF